MKRYEFHPAAELELYEIALRYDAQVPRLGRRFSDEVERVVHLLLDHPELGARLDADLWWIEELFQQRMFGTNSHRPGPDNAPRT